MPGLAGHVTSMATTQACPSLLQQAASARGMAVAIQLHFRGRKASWVRVCSLLTSSLQGAAGVKRNELQCDDFNKKGSTQHQVGRSGGRVGNPSWISQGDGAASLSNSSSMLPTPHTPALRGSLQGPSHRAGLAFEQHRAPTFLHSPVVRSRPIWTAGARLGLQHILPAAAQGAGCPFGEVCGVPAEQTAQPVQEEVAWKQSMREQQRCGSGGPGNPGEGYNL